MNSNPRLMLCTLGENGVGLPGEPCERCRGDVRGGDPGDPSSGDWTLLNVEGTVVGGVAGSLSAGVPCNPSLNSALEAFTTGAGNLVLWVTMNLPTSRGECGSTKLISRYGRIACEGLKLSDALDASVRKGETRNTSIRPRRSKASMASPGLTFGR